MKLPGNVTASIAARCFAGLLLFVPLVGHCLGYEEFDLFWLDASGKPVKANMVDEFPDSPTRAGDDIAGLHLKLASAVVSKKHPYGGQDRTDVGACRISFDKALLKCDAGSGTLGGAYYAGTRYQSGDGSDGKAAGHGKEVDGLFAQYLKLEEYGLMEYAFRCKSGCEGKPDLILLVWHGD